MVADDVELYRFPSWMPELDRWPRFKSPIPAELWQMVGRPDWNGGHWHWTGPVDPRDSSPRFGSKAVRRMLYTVLIGEVPDKHVLRRNCDDPVCVHPGHCDVVPRAKNLIANPAQPFVKTRFIDFERSWREELNLI